MLMKTKHKITPFKLISIIIIIIIYIYQSGFIQYFIHNVIYKDVNIKLAELDKREKELNEREKEVCRRGNFYTLNETELCMSKFYNQCTMEEIPLVSSELESAQFLRYTNSSLIRFGDSEIKLILGRKVKKQTPDPELSRRMNESFHCMDENIALAIPNAFCNCPYYDKHTTDYWRSKKYIREWINKNYNHTRQYLDAHITAVYIITSTTHCVNIDLFYNNMREIWRNKDIVILRGNNSETYTYDVYDTAKSQTVYYGLAENSWSKYEEYRDLLLKEDPNKLFILSIGHLSKILAYDLATQGRRALDLGHLAKDYEYYMKSIPSNYDFFKV